MKGKFYNYVVINAMSAYGRHCTRRYKHIAPKADDFSEKLLLKHLKRNQNTEYGKKYDFASIHSVREYQDRVPFTTYDDYIPYVERMAQTGEQNLLSSDTINFFATTSGTTGVTKRIPVVHRSYNPVFRAASIIYNMINDNMRKTGVHAGRGLNTLESGCEYTPSGIREGYISSFVMSSAGSVVPAITCIPKEVFGYGVGVDMKYIKARYSLADRDLVYLMSIFMSTLTDLMKYISENREMLIKDIAEGRIDGSVKLPPELRAKLEKKLKPDPERAKELEAAIDFSKPEGIVHRIWPKVSTVVAIGGGEFETFYRRMKTYCGPDVRFCFEMYASSEALVASSFENDDPNYVMIPDSGFFEFIPVDDESFDETKDRPLLMHELEEGKNYEVVVTNLAGLYRYRIKDVIKVVGYKEKLPLVRFAYRKQQMINITGLKLTAEHMVSTMRNIAERLKMHINDYSVYADTESEPWRLRVFIEFEEELPEGVDMSAIFDEELAKVNEEHGRMLEIGESSPSEVCIMRKNAYLELREKNASKKISDSQVKSIRYVKNKEQLDDLMARVIRTYK